MTDPLPLLSLANWGVDRSADGEPVLILELRHAGTIMVSVARQDALEMAQALAVVASAIEEPNDF